MPEKESTSNTSTPTSNVDLNSLADLSFGPSWADEKNANKTKKKEYTEGNKQKNDRRPRNINKDRRGPTKFRNDRSDSSFNKKKEHFEKRKPDFIPKFDVKIYPQDETFERLIKQLKGNFKTYQLFEITRLILEKSDRFVCLINRKKNTDEPEQPIYFTPEDNCPFDTEEEAVNHFFEHYLENFFDIETVEVEPPKGNFSVVYRCPFTKVLIGPPNFHRFPELLKAHHSAKIKNLSLEDYQNKLESLSEENFINDWLESTKQQKHYSIKKEINAEEPSKKFITIEEARRFLIANHKDKIVKTSSNFRFSGSKLEELPNSNLKLSLLQSIDAQRRFPLDTANNIRGRLRRHKFTIYKKGSKGISYVCCVKRKFRDDTTVFTESINDLIRFIEKNQQISIQKLPYKFLSLPLPVSEKSSKVEDKELPAENTEVAENNSPSENSESSSKEDNNKITEVIRNLRWLISEGYVTEYSDGKLWVHPKTEVNHATSSTISKNTKTDTQEETSVSSKTEESKNSEAVTEEAIVPDLEEKNTEVDNSEESTTQSCEIPNSTEEESETKVESTDI